MSKQVSGVVIGDEILPLDRGGRQIANPMQYMRGSCTPEEANVLWRWFEARQLAAGDRSVAILNGAARGRYAAFAQRGITIETYYTYEVSAYRWIVSCYLKNSSAAQAEFFARMQGEDTNHDFMEWGALVSNSDDPLIAFGAAVGSTRALAWMLLRGYEIYAEMHKQRQAALRAGRTTSTADARASRVLAVANAVGGHKLAIVGNGQ